MKKNEKLSVSNEVQDILDAMENKGDVVSKTRALNKGLSRDVKLNNFLAADFSKGIKNIVDEKTRERTIEKILKGAAGWTGVDQKRAAVAQILREDATDAAKAYVNRLTKSLVLDDEQKIQVAKKQGELQRYILNTILPGVEEIGRELGIIVEVKAEETAPVTPELVPAVVDQP